MKDRIIQFLAAEEISPAEFADKIGVQRSSMSHILNGRNFPSAAFIQKMLLAYTALNPRWLMIGGGSMYNSPDMAVLSPSQPLQSENSNNKQDSTSITSEIQSTLPFEERIDSASKEPQNQPVQSSQIDSKPLDSDLKHSEILSSLNSISPEAKDIEQILFFFKDKTFSIYRPF